MRGWIPIVLLLISIQCSWSINKLSKFSLNSEVRLELRVFLFMLEYTILKNDEVVQTVSISIRPDSFVKIEDIENGIIVRGFGERIEITYNIDEPDYVEFAITRRNYTHFAQDCIELGRHVNWYGGNQQRWQYFPIQSIRHNHTAYLTKEEINKAITERYWLNSNGVFFYVDLETPLFIDQNNDFPGYLCLEAKKALPYDTHHPYYNFKYYIGVSTNAKTAHMHAVNKFLKKPSDHPSEMMVRKPIFSTWAKYKRHVNESIVREYAKEILDNGYRNSQLEIDDFWEDCYGAMNFNNSRFSNPRKLTDDLKKDGFRVTLWTHPFVNKDCDPLYDEGKTNGYFVADHKGNTDTTWWCSEKNGAALIDFSKTDALNWYVERMKKLQEEDGIDSFKFDAGETSWGPRDPVLNGSWELSPSHITIDYVKTVSQFGPLLEVRTGQSTQNLPIYVRMLDKDTEWTLNNGLPTLITTLLQMNLNGYVFVLPDMVGGNGYSNGSFEIIDPPSKELFVRWLQANVFMPVIQFSFVPWDYDEETEILSHKFVKLHEDYADLIVERFKLAVQTGEPVNPPIWWVDPDDQVAQTIYDEYMLGDKILVAPVIVEGATQRDIYLPGKFKWQDGNTNEIHEGQNWLINYEAPLSVLPFFIRL